MKVFGMKVVGVAWVKVLVVVGLAMFCVGCEYVSEGQWLDKYRPDGNNVDYYLDTFEIKDVTEDDPVVVGDSKLLSDKKIRKSRMTRGLQKVVGKNGSGRSVGESGQLVSFGSVSGLDLPYRSATGITSNFGWRRVDITGYYDTTDTLYPGFHTGVDFDVLGDSSVYSSGDGVVVFMGSDSMFVGYGNHIAVAYRIPGDDVMAEEFAAFARKTNTALSAANGNKLHELLKDSSVSVTVKQVQDAYSGDRYLPYYDYVKKHVDNSLFLSAKTYALVTALNALGEAVDLPANPVFGGPVLTRTDKVKLPYGWGNDVVWTAQAEWDFVCRWAKEKSKWVSRRSDVEKIIAHCDLTMVNEQMLPNDSLFSGYVMDSVVLPLSEILFDADYDAVSVSGASGFFFGRYGFSGGFARECLNRISEAVRGSGASGKNVTLFYAHLDRFADGVKEGGIISKDQVIGYEGNTGHGSGAHLHLAASFYDPLKRGDLRKISDGGGHPSDEAYTSGRMVDVLKEVFRVSTAAEMMEKYGIAYSGSVNAKYKEFSLLERDVAFLEHSRKYTTNIYKDIWGK
jgi:hypothetical protein